MAAKAKKKAHRPHPSRYVAQHLKRPWHKGYIKQYQEHVTNQAQFMAAQDALQRQISAIRQTSLTGNPYI
jgi:hypothetical protein